MNFNIRSAKRLVNVKTPLHIKKERQTGFVSLVKNDLLTYTGPFSDNTFGQKP